jgi:hypothetical protein
MLSHSSAWYLFFFGGCEFIRELEGERIFKLLAAPVLCAGGFALPVVGPADPNHEAGCFLWDQNTQTHGTRQEFLLGSSSRLWNHIVVQPRFAAGVHVVIGVGVASLFGWSVERCEKSGEIPTGGRLRENLGEVAEIFLGAYEVDLERVNQLASYLRGCHPCGHAGP